tara:strand:- start:139 stop:297 length:159 start_codon:yes stop_codon:yes gene_type:complete
VLLAGLAALLAGLAALLAAAFDALLGVDGGTLLSPPASELQAAPPHAHGSGE